MSPLPYWPKNATLLHTLYVAAGLYSLTALVLGIIGGSTRKFIHSQPSAVGGEGPSVWSGFWADCVVGNGVDCAKQDQPDGLPNWRRATQAFHIVFIASSFLATALFFAAAKTAAPKEATRHGADAAAAGAARKAKAAATFALLAAVAGIVATCIFVSQTMPQDSSQMRTIAWSGGMFIGGTALSVLIPSLGYAPVPGNK